MKRILKIFILTFIIFCIFNNYLDIIKIIKFSFSLCFHNLFPSLIPFMLLSNILINYNFVYDLSNILNKIMTRIFKVNKNCSFALIMSIISGTPSNAKYLKDLYDNKLINIDDVKKNLKFCHFINPIFILGTIGYVFLNNKKLGLVLLISHYLSSIILGLTNNKYNINNENKFIKQNNNNLIKILNESIISVTNTLILILGIITTCLIIIIIINSFININENYKFLYGLIEMTIGLKYLQASNINILYKTVISSFLISFGGLCIHLQVMSIVDNKKIRYSSYFIYRILHGIISSIITLLILKLIPIY